MDNSSSFEKSSETITPPLGPVNQDPKGHPSAKKTLVRAAGIVSLMTLTSRILGMIRDIVTANRFGTSWQWDAFIYAFMLPNFFRRLVGEGALSNAFIPVYSRTLHTEGKEAAFRFANVMATVLSAGLVVFMLGAEAVLHYLYHADFLSDRLHLTVDLLRIFFPYLFFISIFALAMGILNCHQHFFTPSLGPVILDLAWIGGVIFIVPLAGNIPQDQLRALAIVLLISGILQVAVEIAPLKKMGLQFRWIPDFSEPHLKQTFRLILPAIMSFAVVQVNMLIDMVLGYFIGPGANSSLWYGTRLMQFPLGVFGIAMGTALLPTISAQIARKEIEASKKTMSFALRSVALILLPCTVGLIVLAKPIIQMLFERGEFDAVSTARTASVLIFYSIGLLSYSGEKMIATGFFAAHDMKTPMVMGAITLVFDTILNLILMQFLREGGLALATSIASIFEFSVLIYLYQKKISGLPLREIFRSYLKIFAASLAMGLVCYFAYGLIAGRFPSEALFDKLIGVFGTIGISVLTYVAFCFLFRVSEMKEAIEFIRKKTHDSRVPRKN
jgi:putative peptidoglycan lipid II flippase